MQAPDCLFCKIAKREIPSDMIYEDEKVFSFLDIRGNNPGHTLVIPKNHHKNIFDIDEETLKELIVRVKKIARAVKEGVEAGGVNIAMNNEKAAGQVVFHAHFHIIPRFEGDGYTFWPQKPYEEGGAKKVAGKIREAL